MKIILNLSIGLLLSFPVFAQSMREPTPAEKKVLMRVIEPINQNINLFPDNDWEMTERFGDQDIDVPNGSKSQLACSYLVALALKEGAPLYIKLTQNIQRLMQENKNDSLEAAYAALEKQSLIHVDIAINGEVVTLGNMPKKNIQLKIPGATQAFIVALDNNTTRRTGAIVLAFGNWNNAKYDSENHCYRFHYSHFPQTPFVENVVIEMYGNTDRIKEILKKSDWSKVAASLDQ